MPTVISAPDRPSPCGKPDSNLPSDIAAYQACYGTDRPRSTTSRSTAGFLSGAGEGEAALDIETIIGLAPEATIDVYQQNETADGLDAYTAMVSQDTAKVISISYGECETDRRRQRIDRGREPDLRGGSQPGSGHRGRGR